MPARQRTSSISIYLLKDSVSGVDDALKSDAAIISNPICSGPASIGTLYHKTTPSRPPRWIKFFGSYLNTSDFLTSSISAVLIVPAAGRLFALAFGQGGRHLLEPGCYEEDFGLRVCLNSVSPEAVRSIDRKALDASGRHSREQASRNIPIIEFGLDIDKDILRAVTGPPSIPALGMRLAGADALSVVAKLNIDQVREQLAKYLRQHKKRDYKKLYPWVDNIREVSDAALKTTLDGDLQVRIIGRRLDRIWMAVPDLVDWHGVAGFSFSRRDHSNLLDDITLDSYLENIGEGDISIDTLKRNRVYCISAETGFSVADWPVYRCIYAELDRGRRTFLLNNGRWYEIASEYVDEVNRAITRIPASTSLHLPEYNDVNETEYNKRVKLADSRNYALMDRKMIHYGGGRSKIEFCDLYSLNKQMVHVKRYGGSGTLSHLFAQGTVSANLFLNDPGFRTKVNQSLPSSHKISSPQGQVRTSDYEVAFVIASRAAGPLVLPFFSRVTLRSAWTQLRNIGYAVTLTKVACI